MGRFIPLVLCLLPLCRATALVNSEKASLSSCHCSHSHWFYQSDVTASWGNRLMAVSHIGKIGAAMLHRSVALLQSTMLSSSLSSLLSKIYHNSHHRHHYRIYYSLIATGFFSATAEIALVGGHYAVQGHSRSLILVTIESPYATSYLRIILTDILPRTVCLITHSVDKIIIFWVGVPLF